MNAVLGETTTASMWGQGQSMHFADGFALELAYAKIFGTQPNGGADDGSDDVPTGNPRIGSVQIKTSQPGLLKHLGKSLQFKTFQPVCVGDPGNREEMIDSILNYGGWVGRDVEDRITWLEGIAKVRNQCPIDRKSTLKGKNR